METSKKQETDVGPSPVWVADIMDRVFFFLPPNQAWALRFLGSGLLLKAQCDLAQPMPAWAFPLFLSGAGSCRGMNRKQRERLAALAAPSGSLASLQLALSSAVVPPSFEHLKAAAGAGDLQTCQWLTQPGRLWVLDTSDWEGLLKTAASAGHMPICRWAMEHSPSVSSQATRQAAMVAARGGHAAACEELLAAWRAAREVQRLPPDLRLEAERDILVAVMHGCDLDTVQRLCGGAQAAQLERLRLEAHARLLVAVLAGRTPDWAAKAAWIDSPQAVLPEAANAGPDAWARQALRPALHAALYSPAEDWRARVEWCVARGAQACWSLEPFDRQAMHVQQQQLGTADVPTPSELLERLQWVQERALGRVKSASWASRLAVRMVREGNAALLRWLLRAGVQPDSNVTRPALERAAGAGHVEVLAALHEASHPMDASALARAAARGGSLAVLQWVLRALYPAPEPAPGTRHPALTPPLFAAAAGSGSSEVVRWLVAHGCPTSEEAWEEAARSGCEAAVAVLAELGVPRPDDGSPYAAAVEAGEWRMLTCLRGAGLRFNRREEWWRDGGEARRLLVRVIEGGAPMPALQWVVAEWGPFQWGAVGPKAMEAAMGRLPLERDEVLAWLAQQEQQQREQHEAGQ